MISSHAVLVADDNIKKHIQNLKEISLPLLSAEGSSSILLSYGVPPLRGNSQFLRRRRRRRRRDTPVNHFQTITLLGLAVAWTVKRTLMYTTTFQCFKFMRVCGIYLFSVGAPVSWKSFRTHQPQLTSLLSPVFCNEQELLQSLPGPCSYATDWVYLRSTLETYRTYKTDSQFKQNSCEVQNKLDEFTPGEFFFKKNRNTY